MFLYSAILIIILIVSLLVTVFIVDDFKLPKKRSLMLNWAYVSIALITIGAGIYFVN